MDAPAATRHRFHPVTWEELENGVRVEDFTIRNVRERMAEVGDLWRPLFSADGRFTLETLT